MTWMTVQTCVISFPEVAVQGTGLPSLNLGSGYTNTDFTITDETDMTDIWHMLVYAKTKYSSQFDMGQLIDSRERRRIVGDFEMGVLDQQLGRTYPDTVSVAYSNFDTHSYTVDSYFLVDHPEKKGIWVDVPYRCFLPKGLDGLLVIGIGMSVHRDALPLVRMQPDVQNHGYMAGLAAATVGRTQHRARLLAFGRPENAEEKDLCDYVLEDFTEKEKKLLHTELNKVIEALDTMICGSISDAMNKYNRKSKLEQ